MTEPTPDDLANANEIALHIIQQAGRLAAAEAENERLRAALQRMTDAWLTQFGAEWLASEPGDACDRAYRAAVEILDTRKAPVD